MVNLLLISIKFTNPKICMEERERERERERNFLKNIIETKN